MKLLALKKMPVEDAVSLINQDLDILSRNNKTTHSFGKPDVEGLQIECSWSSIHKYYGQFGYRLNRNNYQYEFVEGLNNMQVREVAQDSITEPQLTSEEIEFIRTLMSQQQGVTSVNNTEIELKISVKEGEKKTTGVSVYVDTWDEWMEFKKAYPYSGTDVLDLALREFMDKYKKKES